MAREGGAPAVRRFSERDAADIRGLVAPEIAASRYPSGARAALDTLIARTDPDSSALVAFLDETLAGLMIHGAVAGALGAGRLQLIVVAPPFRRLGIATALVEAALADLRTVGARAVFVEMAADAALAPSAALLERCGFELDARVSDFFRDGVDLIVLRRDLHKDGADLSRER